jgi:hypothetical protein
LRNSFDFVRSKTWREEEEEEEERNEIWVREVKMKNEIWEVQVEISFIASGIMGNSYIGEGVKL